jgi:hypothetical protein
MTLSIIPFINSTTFVSYWWELREWYLSFLCSFIPFGALTRVLYVNSFEWEHVILLHLEGVSPRLLGCWCHGDLFTEDHEEAKDSS